MFNREHEVAKWTETPQFKSLLKEIRIRHSNEQRELKLFLVLVTCVYLDVTTKYLFF